MWLARVLRDGCELVLLMLAITCRSSTAIDGSKQPVTALTSAVVASVGVSASAEACASPEACASAEATPPAVRTPQRADGGVEASVDATEVVFCSQRWKRDARWAACHDRDVVDIAPLGQLTKLEQLDLAGARVSDIAALSGLVYLRDVNLTANPVQDLRPLARASRVEVLRLDGTKVDDLSPLAGCLPLKELSLNSTSVKTLAPIVPLPKLERVEFQRTQVSFEKELAWMAQNPRIRMTNEQVRRLSLFRLLEARPEGLFVERHGNRMVKEVGVVWRGRKLGWWASFDDRGDLIKEQRFVRGDPLEWDGSWTYNREHCLNSDRVENWAIARCLKDGLTLTVSERMAVLHQAERRLVRRNDPNDPKNVLLIGELLSAATASDPSVRRAITSTLVRAQVLSARSASRVPPEEEIEEVLESITPSLPPDYRPLRSFDCSVVRGSGERLEIACSRFAGCEHSCLERHARILIVRTKSEWRLEQHSIETKDMGLCGCCMGSG